MNTPPPESEFPKLDLLPSLSMPAIQSSNAESSAPPPVPPIPAIHRRRRHTINKPDAALALLSESDEGETDEQTLDRISGILSNLIQEANEAVQNGGSTTSKQRPNSSTLMKDRRRHSMYSPSQPIDNAIPCRSKSISRLPRPSRQPQYNYIWMHDRPSSGSSCSASSTSLFSPGSIIDSPATSSSSIEQQQQKDDHQQQQQPYDLEYLDHQRSETDDDDGINGRRTTHNTTPITGLESMDMEDDISYGEEEGDYDDETRQTQGDNSDDDDNYTDDDDGDDDDDDDNNVSQQHQQMTSLTPMTRRHTLSRSDPLIESLRRLDTSMALVESLSRDLAEEMQQPYQTASETEEPEEPAEPPTAATTSTTAAEKVVRPTSFISSTSTSKLTLLLLPLLHIPHALITTVFDTLTTPGSSNTTTWNFSSPSPSHSSSSSSTSSFVNHPTSSSPSSLSGMIAWTFFFALANMAISWSSVATPHDFIQQRRQQQRLPPSPSPRQSLSDQRPRTDMAIQPRRLSLPGSYGSINNDDNNNNDHPATLVMNTSNSNSRMVRFRRPAPINTTLCVKRSSSSTYSVRRTTTTTTTTTSTIKRTTSKKRLNSNDHHHHQQQQQQQKEQQLRQLQQLQRQVQQARRLSSTYMDASKHSNDTSFTLTLQRSRVWKQQQHLRHQRLRKPDYLMKKSESTRNHPVPPLKQKQKQKQHLDPLWTHHRRYSF